MKRYDAYRDSGVKWIGEIPSHWEVKKLRSCFQERCEKVSDKVFAPLSVSKLGVTPQLETAVKTDNGDNRKKVSKGDFVVNSRSDRKGSCGFSDFNGSVSLINIVLAPRNINSLFYHYLFRSNNYIEEFYSQGRGIVADLWTTRYSEMKNIYIPVPPLHEQQAIADYLKDKTLKIEQYVSERERERELLDSLKQSEIANVVTKGLNPNVKMKDSGIPWIGMIPEHWEVSRLKNHVTLVTTPSSSPLKIGLENIEGFTGKFIETETEYDGNGIGVDINDLVYGKLRPYLCKAWLATFPCNAIGDFYVLRSKSCSLSISYLHKLFLSQQVTGICNASTYGAKMPRVSSSFIMCLPIPVPPLSEQQAVVAYIDEKLQKIDQYMSDLQREIDYLKEFKQRLISDAVTGQICVTKQ